MLLAEKTLLRWEILIFGYGPKWRACPYLGIRFLAITQPFFNQLGWNFLWKVRKLLSIDCWLEIAIDVMMIILHLWFFRPWGLIRKWALKTQLKSRPTGCTYRVSRYFKITLLKFHTSNPLPLTHVHQVQFKKW